MTVIFDRLSETKLQNRRKERECGCYEVVLGQKVGKAIGQVFDTAAFIDAVINNRIPLKLKRA